MQLRTFLAGNMREALDCVRKEMGEDAVIVASERAKGGGIVVRAALDSMMPANDTEGTDGYAPVPDPQPAPDIEAGFREQLIARLRMPGATGTVGRNFDRAELLSILRAHRSPDAVAHELAEAAEKSALTDMTLALASALDKRMRVKTLDLPASSSLLLCGPPGAGKTATAAKIAAHAKLAGRNVQMIATDAAGAGAVARLETFARHIGVATTIAESAAELEKSIIAATGEKVFTIIDTAGFDPRHGKLRSAFSALSRIESVDTVAILSATADAEEISELGRSLVTLGATRMIVTGLDLARRAGALLAAAVKGPALAHVTRSPFVAGGLETLTPLSLARLLIESERADRGSTQ